MNSMSSLLSMSHTKFSLVPNIFTSVGGQSWCLRLFFTWEKVHKRGELGNIQLAITFCSMLKIEKESSHWKYIG
jgi:hypothetical protein